ncbi:hypothetical protein DL239_15140 [Sedimentitalea sp. CY04]|uniref:Uncharacterized protein n=1 Tax=Parasedimentitalea denitrificans TaxID=2211118 RepID=A0ABX0W9I4_9RHOB|nr:hypothetical protein [Sedimentitalea sp. CY04]NIZ62309.1 hypothetical protein [Sedimentitalea sp. CY04]
MTDSMINPARPTESLMQAWIYRKLWTMNEAVALAAGITPVADADQDSLQSLQSLLERTERDGMRAATPKQWLWWGEKNDMPFHSDWWLAITPEGPTGFDGQHFAFNRGEMLSDAYLQQERRLINKWARKPYWTPREAIDLSLNFDPFTTDGWRGEAPETGETIREREDRFQMLERAAKVGDISEEAAPGDYILWLNKCGYIVSEAWWRAVGLKSSIIESIEADQLAALTIENEKLRQDVKTKTDRIEELEAAEKSVSTDGQAVEIERLKKETARLKTDPENPREKAALTRRLNSLQKALLAAAVDGYSYDPRRARSDVAQQIAAKSDELGCPVTSQTVAKHLNESAEEHVDQAFWTAIYP